MAAKKKIKTVAKKTVKGAKKAVKKVAARAKPLGDRIGNG